MDYELLVALRDAGFPQAGRGMWVGNPASLVVRAGDRVYAPTLEELIEACSSQLYQIENRFGQDWRAIGETGTHHGATPAEAVARLWISLQAT
jgi:hypothetical protein